MNELLAYLEGRHIGTFFSSSGQLGFRYADSAPGMPISLSMPRGRETYGNRQASAFLWGLLPDNQVAIENMAREAGTSANSVFGILSFHGRDVAGALQLLPPGEPPSDADLASVDEPHDRLSDHDLEWLLVDTLDRYVIPAPQRSEAFKFSVAGAQPKIALTADRTGNSLVPSKRLPTTHIIKPNFAGSDYFISEVEAIEWISLKAAATLGLNVADVRLWQAPSGNVQALIVHRYDRYLDDRGFIRRIHQEDFCQALSIMPEKKYQHHYGGPGVGAIAQLIRTAVPRTDRSKIAEEFFKALVFNVGIVGTDAHAKNYSLLLADRISLAPLYDVISAAAHIDLAQAAYFPMKIGKTFAIDEITVPGLISEGRKLGLSAQDAERHTEQILSSVEAAVVSAATEFGREDLADKLADGIAKKSPARWLH